MRFPYMGCPDPLAISSLFRDRDGYLAILTLLVGSGSFEDVVLGKPFSMDRFTSNEQVVASIEPTGAATSEDGSPTREFREPRFMLTLGFRAEGSPEDTYQAVDRLDAIVRNLLLSAENRAYGGFCLPKYSKLSAARVDESSWPEVRVIYEGCFAYCVSLVSSSYSELN